SLVSRLARRPASRLGMAAVLVLAVGAVQWGQARGVFEGHQAIGRALEWAYANKGDRKLEWLPTAWFRDPTSLTSLEELEQAAPDTWLISFYPSDFIANHASLLPYLEDTQPLASWPSLHGTDAYWAD